jgi:NADH-quinone oxidoreductase subunit E
VLIGRDTYEDLTPETFEKVLDAIARGETPKPGPQNGRQFSAPLGGDTTLLEVAAPPTVAATAPPAATDAEALAAAEEADINAKLATLSKDATPEEKANAVGIRPQGLTAARDDAADNLQRIKGIGPVNENKLHALGIFHFSQIAGWSRQEIRWVGTYLAFPGRIDREHWVSQAAVLASGGDNVLKPEKTQS